MCSSTLLQERVAAAPQQQQGAATTYLLDILFQEMKFTTGDPILMTAWFFAALANYFPTQISLLQLQGCVCRLQPSILRLFPVTVNFKPRRRQLCKGRAWVYCNYFKALNDYVELSLKEICTCARTLVNHAEAAAVLLTDRHNAPTETAQTTPLAFECF